MNIPISGIPRVYKRDICELRCHVVFCLHFSSFRFLPLDGKKYTGYVPKLYAEILK